MPPRARDLAFAVLLTAAATAAQWALVRVTGPVAPFLVYWLAIIGAAYLRGAACATTTLGLSLVVSGYLFVFPYRTFWPMPVASAVTILAFAVAGSAAAALGGAMHAARNEAVARARVFRETLDAFTSPFFSLDRDWRFTFMNERRAKATGHDAHALEGRVIWDEFPVLIGTEYERRYREVMRTREPVRFEAFGPISGTWYEVNVFPSPEGGIGVFFYDRSEQRRATDALVAADRDKDEFLAILSHELRTPLNVISGWTHVLQRRRHDCAPDLHKPIETIARNASLLTRLVNDLVDISRFMRGKFTHASEPLQIDGIVRHVAMQAEPTLRARGLSLRLDVDDVVSPVLGDEQRLTQVISNLLNNAVKFTPDGGRITIAVHGTGPRVAVRVTDTGIGIRRELLPFVFDPFRQGEQRPERVGGGLGLGLAIARSIVEAHGGHLTAASDGPGQGATFVIELPAIG